MKGNQVLKEKKSKKVRPSQGYLVRTKGLVKTFGEIRAVDGLDLKIRKGQLYGLLGPNGSGKTTTIKMIMGLLKINAGVVNVLGARMPNKDIMHKIGYMPQENAIYKEITISDNLILFGEMYEVPKKSMKKRADEILKLVNLMEWKNEISENLSGGMMHRLSLACCLMHDPKILFLDEPTVGVDPELRDTLWGYFKSLTKKGKTIIITTHYIEEARHCDMVGLMRNGRIIAEDAPGRLMERAGTRTLEEAFLHFTRRDREDVLQNPQGDDGE